MNKVKSFLENSLSGMKYKDQNFQIRRIGKKKVKYLKLKIKEDVDLVGLSQLQEQ